MAATADPGAQRPSTRPWEWKHLQNWGEVYTARTGHSVVNHDGTFFLFGGTDGAARQSDVHAYNVECNIWSYVQCKGVPPPARSGTQSVVFQEGQNSKVIFFGGYTKKDGQYFNDLHEFDIQEREWRQVRYMGEAPSKRTDHTVVLHGRSMWVFGGFDGRQRYNDLRELDLAELRWNNITTAAGNPKSRFGHAAVSYNHSMFIFGGWDGHDTLQELYEYNFQTSAWYPITLRGTAPRPRYRHSAVVNDQSMWIFGGVDKEQCRFSDLFEFCFNTRSWNAVNITGSVPSARTFHRAVTHGDYMYILGGFDGRRQNDTHVILLHDRNVPPRPGYNVTKGGASSSADVGMSGDASAGSMAEPNRYDWNESSGAYGNSANSASVESMAAVAEPANTFLPEECWRWQKIIPTTEDTYSARTGHAVIVWNNKFYLFGGTDENARQSDIHFFDVIERRWNKVPGVSGPCPSSRSGAKAIVYRECIYFFGGYTKKDGDYFNDLHCYDIVRKKWQKFESHLFPVIPSVRTDHTCVCYGDRMYIFYVLIFFTSSVFNIYVDSDIFLFLDIHRLRSAVQIDL